MLERQAKTSNSEDNGALRQKINAATIAPKATTIIGASLKSDKNMG